MPNATEIRNPTLRRHINSSTHAVVVKFLGAWSVVTWCRSRTEACMCLKRWLQRSSWELKIIQIKENANG